MNSCALAKPLSRYTRTRASTQQIRQFIVVVIESYAATQDAESTAKDRKQLIHRLWNIHINRQRTLHALDTHRIHVAFMVHLLIGILCLRDARQKRDYMNARSVLQKAERLFSIEYSTFKNHSINARTAMKLLKFEVLFNLLFTYKLPLTADTHSHPEYIILYKKVFQSAVENKLSNVLRFLELMHTTVTTFQSASTATTPLLTCTLQNAELCVDLSVIQCKYDMSVSAQYLGSLLRSMDPQQKLFDSRWVNREILTHWEPLGAQSASAF